MSKKNRTNAAEPADPSGPTADPAAADDLTAGAEPAPADPAAPDPSVTEPAAEKTDAQVELETLEAEMDRLERELASLATDEEIKDRLVETGRAHAALVREKQDAVLKYDTLVSAAEQANRDARAFQVHTLQARVRLREALGTAAGTLERHRLAMGRSPAGARVREITNLARSLARSSGANVVGVPAGASAASAS